MIAFVRPAAPRNRYIQNVPLNYIHLAAYIRERGYDVAAKMTNLSNVRKVARALARRMFAERTASVN